MNDLNDGIGVVVALGIIIGGFILVLLDLEKYDVPF